jgi:hypothetical protein
MWGITSGELLANRGGTHCQRSVALIHCKSSNGRTHLPHYYKTWSVRQALEEEAPPPLEEEALYLAFRTSMRSWGDCPLPPDSQSSILSLMYSIVKPPVPDLAYLKGGFALDEATLGRVGERGEVLVRAGIYNAAVSAIKEHLLALALGLVELARGCFILHRAMEGVHGDFCDDVAAAGAPNRESHACCQRNRQLDPKGARARAGPRAGKEPARTPAAAGGEQRS